METSAAIRLGTAGPASLGEFNLRAELWKRLGMKLEEFEQLPWKTAEDYLTFLKLIIREENEQNRRNRGGPGR